jgi:hypothetical protein
LPENTEKASVVSQLSCAAFPIHFSHQTEMWENRKFQDYSPEHEGVSLGLLHESVKNSGR